MISAKFPYEKKFQAVNGKQIAYVDEGEGDPIVLLHGNPTSSYLWRNIIPELKGCGRVIVPDLIGQGDSEKLPVADGAERYSFAVAYDYLAGFFDALGLDANITLVVHDWGSGLGFHWARNHPGAVKGIAYMEAIVRPVSWEEWPETGRGIFQSFRSDKGEELVLERNLFVEAVLPSAILRKLTEEEMEHYRAPFQTPDDRQPTLNWPRHIPIEGEPESMVDLVDDYARWMAKSELPKLFINADPGSILVGRQREVCRSWPNQVEITVPGNHFMQEDSPDEIGHAAAGFVRKLRG